MSPIRVLLVDDHPVIRNGIHNLLAKESDIEIVGETGSGVDALQLARELNPDVMLLDMQLQGMNGVDVVRELQKDVLNIRVLAFSAHNDPEYVQELLKCGASGYLCKDESTDFILSAVRGVANGEKGWFSRKISAQISQWQVDRANPHAGMTQRENQVMEQVVMGKTNREIAFALGISEKTVEKHLESVFHKLDVSSRTEAAVWVAREERNQAGPGL